MIPAIKALLDDTGSWAWKAVVATQVCRSNGLCRCHGWELELIGQDYHPKGHMSFASSHANKKPFDTASLRDGWDRQVDLTLWPDHCVQGAKGAEIDKELRRSFEPWKSRMKIVRKVRPCLLQQCTDQDGRAGTRRSRITLHSKAT